MVASSSPFLHRYSAMNSMMTCAHFCMAFFTDSPANTLHIYFFITKSTAYYHTSDPLSFGDAAFRTMGEVCEHTTYIPTNTLAPSQYYRLLAEPAVKKFAD